MSGEQTLSGATPSEEYFWPPESLGNNPTDFDEYECESEVQHGSTSSHPGTEDTSSPSIHVRGFPGVKVDVEVDGRSVSETSHIGNVIKVKSDVEPKRSLLDIVRGKKKQTKRDTSRFVIADPHGSTASEKKNFRFRDKDK